MVNCVIVITRYTLSKLVTCVVSLNLIWAALLSWVYIVDLFVLALLCFDLVADKYI